MSLLALVLIAVLWFALGVLSYGFTFAHFQYEFPIIAEENLKMHRSLAREAFLLGPLSLIVAFLLNHYKHGLVYKTPYSMYRHVEKVRLEFINGNLSSGYLDDPLKDFHYK